MKDANSVVFFQSDCLGHSILVQLLCTLPPIRSGLVCILTISRKLHNIVQIEAANWQDDLGVGVGGTLLITYLFLWFHLYICIIQKNHKIEKNHWGSLNLHIPS